MAITVAELLAEPQLGLSLIAGASGLENQLTSAHTSDLPRLWEWVTGGEILMTNGMSIPEDAAGQVAMARSLVGAGAQALAIGAKMHAPELQPEFLAVCDELSLPIVNVPFPLPFTAIARSVATASQSEEFRRLRQTARIYELLRLPSAAEGQWAALVQGIATVLKSNIFVVDKRCLHPWHPEGAGLPDDVREQVGRFTGGHAEAAKSFQWHFVDDRHILMMEIPTHPNAILVVLPESQPHPDAVVLLHAATVLGLELSRTALGLESQQRLGAEFLRQAFEGHFDVAEMENRLDGFGIPAGNFMMVSMSCEDEQKLATIHQELWQHGYSSVCLFQGDRLHIAISAECRGETLLHVAGPGMRIGISAMASTHRMIQAQQESLWALGSAESGSEPLVHYSDGPSWLGVTSHEQGLAIVKRLLGPIIDYEQGKQPDLMVTLRTYLELQRSWQKTATALFTHRQTIIYRIRKIGELTGLDMSETSSLAQLWFALEIQKVMQAS